MQEHKARINMLDGFRCIAILMVMLYHYYSRWTPPVYPVNYYPYGNSLSPYFMYGYLGVHFFFIISGFVIFYTLEKSKTAVSFFIKRFIRLFPPMLICSLISYFTVKAFDAANKFPALHSSSPADFLPGFTFTHPIVWVKLLHNDTVNYIDGSYWSLWVEACFYVLSGCLFFLNKQKFIKNWAVLLLFTAIFKLAVLPALSTVFQAHPAVHRIVDTIILMLNYFKIVSFLIYFSLGILCYCLFFKRKLPAIFITACILAMLEELCLLQNGGELIGVLLMLVVFLLFVYRPQYMAFLKSRLITRIGVISYSVYLLHQNVGVLLINKLSVNIQSPILLKLIPLVVITIIIAFAELLYGLYEKPVMQKLTALLVKQTPGPA